MLDSGRDVNEIARALGVSRATVCYHKREARISDGATAALLRYDWAAIQRYYDAGQFGQQTASSRFGFSRVGLGVCGEARRDHSAAARRCRSTSC